MASSGGGSGEGGSESAGKDDKTAEPKFRPSRDGARPGSQARLGRTAVDDAFRVVRNVNGVEMVDSIPRPTTSAGQRALNIVMVSHFHLNHSSLLLAPRLEFPSTCFDGSG